ncbi:hypothetical protein [Cyclobacterium marinum]|uniref:hypothetical protein n=1 Tax=Cyclobacterium marinum TaxID=104 RepID=UPI0011ED3163|nr:hypothetical protein [Cyclobacterium marinum]MBI0400586.1 hypothetical protein [Cyclobacterium marinum]
MIKKPSTFLLQTLGSDVDFLYMRLHLNVHSILNLVDEENRNKGHFNPKTDTILDCDEDIKFREHHTLLRGLNSYVYHNSLILAGFSIFEFALKSICNYISDKFENSETFDDRPTGVIENCISYIKRTELVSFNSKEIDKYYMEIKKVNKLRNLIAHYNGNLRKDMSKSLEKQKNYNVYNSDKRLFIQSNGQIYIDDCEYIKSFVKSSESFIKLIIKQLKE